MQDGALGHCGALCLGVATGLPGVRSVALLPPAPAPAVESPLAAGADAGSWWVAVCSEACVEVYCVPGGMLRGEGGAVAHVARLSGHLAPVSDAAFVAPRTPRAAQDGAAGGGGGAAAAAPLRLVTVGVDRTFKVWDVQARSFLFSSAIISPSPFTCAHPRAVARAAPASTPCYPPPAGMRLAPSLGRQRERWRRWRGAG